MRSNILLILVLIIGLYGIAFSFQGDINSDGFINWKDMEVFSDLWLTGSGSADLNGDSEVDIADLALLAQHWLDIVKATEPYPPDSSANTGTSLVLSWRGGDNADNRDIFFGTVNPPPFLVNTTDTAFEPNTLSLNTTYYWRVEEKSASGIVIGDTWSFETHFIWYVKQGAAGQWSSWSDASGDLRDVLEQSMDGDEVWVAAGTYKPDSADRSKSFILKSGISLFGGFVGDEVNIDERDWAGNKTILSGDLDADGLNGDDSFHVVKGADNSVIDGFVIIGGNANGTGDDSKGGGMLNISVSPAVRNCSFLGNFAQAGGAIYNESSLAQVTNCLFSGSAVGSSSGAVYNNQANVSLVNCTFSNNTNSAIYNSNCSPGIVNCIVWGDQPVINISGNPYISYSDIQGSKPSGVWHAEFGKDGGHNIDDGPLFADADGTDNIAGTIDDDLSLQQGSPCIGTGLGREDIGVNWPVDAKMMAEAAVGGSNLVDIAIADNNDVYVLDSRGSGASYVLVYDEQLQLKRTVDISAVNPLGIAIDGNSDPNIYVADTGNNRILKYKNNGVLDTSFDGDGIVGQFGTGNAQFNAPSSLAVVNELRTTNNELVLYVADSGNNRIQIFGSTGAFIGKWGQGGSGDGQLNNPAGFCMTGSTLLIADSGNHRVQQLSAESGYFYEKVGSYGTHAGQFNNPKDVCYDINYNQMIVTDTGNNRLQIYQLSNYGGPVFVKSVDDAGLSSPSAVAVPKSVVSGLGSGVYVCDTGNGRIVKLQMAQDISGNSPLAVFEVLKTAIYIGDITKAVNCFADISKGTYEDIFLVGGAYLKNEIGGMGDMATVEHNGYTAVYELSYLDGSETIYFHVFFEKDVNGNWKILQF